MRLAERYPDAHADPRARGDLRPRLALARAARAPERADRHVVVEPGRPGRAVRAGAAGEHRVGERLAVRAPAGRRRRRRCAARCRPGSRPRSCAGSRAGRSRACSTGEPPEDLGPPPGQPARRSTCCSSASSRNLVRRVRPARRGQADPVGAARCSRGCACAVGTDGPLADVFAAVLEAARPLRGRARAAAARPALPGRGALPRARARRRADARTCRCRRCPTRRRRRAPRQKPERRAAPVSAASARPG